VDRWAIGLLGLQADGVRADERASMAFSLRKAPAKTLVGLDIEPGRIAAAEVSVNGSVRLERAATIDLPVGAVRDGEVVDVPAVTAALKQLWSEHKGLGRDVRIGVANSKIVVRTLDLPPVDASELDAVVRQVVTDELPMPMESAVLDYEAVGIVETAAGPRQRVVIVAARKEMVEAAVAAAGAAGLKTRGVDLSAFAMIRILGGRRKTDSGLYLSIGGMANLAVVVDGVCTFTRVTGAGLEGLGMELAERRSLTVAHARMWLRHVGFEADLAEIDGDPDIVADTRAILIQGSRRLAGDIRASLEFHRTQAVAGADVERAVLTGAAVAVPGFAVALASELGMPVETRSVAAGKNFTGDGDLAGMTVAAGLAVEEVPA
jgi:type IV pilus assembly protein PilM